MDAAKKPVAGEKKIREKKKPEESALNRFQAMPIREYYENSLNAVLTQGLREIAKKRLNIFLSTKFADFNP